MEVWLSRTDNKANNELPMFDDTDSDHDDNSNGTDGDYLAQDMEADSGRMEVIGMARIVASLVPGREAT